VDIVPEFEPDICEDITTLEVRAGRVDSLYLGHVFEHLDQPIGALLRWFEVLKPGGYFIIAMPDHRKAVELWMNAERFPVLDRAASNRATGGYYGLLLSFQAVPGDEG
jgi:SAM-dependent methyltransferase